MIIFLASCAILPVGGGEKCTSHKDKNDDGVCDSAGCGKSFADGCDRHRDANDDEKCDNEGCGKAFSDGKEIPVVEKAPTYLGTHCDKNTDGECDLCGNPFTFGDGEVAEYTAAISLHRGVEYDITDILSDTFDLDGAVWSSDCESLVSVNGGIFSAKKCGNTTVSLKDAEGKICTVSVCVSVYVNDSGFDISSVIDSSTHKVSSEREANELIDLAIFNHVAELKLDFSSFGSSYIAYKDFHIEYELTSHVSLTKSYYESTPHLLTIRITYKSDTATTYAEKTPLNTYPDVINGNHALRLEAESKENARADDFDGFAIYKSNSGKRSVRNSEELWWALEHNYLPTFPNEFTAAEKYFEEAKAVLREIIYDGMSDYEKLLSIYEYLVSNVEYDYDALDGIDAENPRSDMCYYLEGVFERGRAVCDGKSKAFLLLCKIEGIECVRDFGEGYSGVGHAWNYVKLDGKWYLVDTTDGDAKQTAISGIGQFFGSGVEYTTYTPFLAPLSYHKSKYKYSSLFEDISSLGGSYHSESFIDMSPSGADYDFRINSDAELANLVRAVISSGISGDVMFTLTISPSVRWNIVIDEVLAEYSSSAKFSAFIGETNGLSVRFLLFRGL